jgi:hypothetical protein
MLVALRLAEAVPARHNVHEATPVPDHEPAAHGIHVSMLVAVIAIEEVPAAHGVHVVAPSGE